MRARAISRNVRMSAEKMGRVVRSIQGMDAAAALAALKAVPRKSARIAGKTLASAMANAVENHGMDREGLVVEEAVAGQARTIRRVRPRARGSASPIRKRYCHVRIVIGDGKEA